MRIKKKPKKSYSRFWNRRSRSALLENLEMYVSSGLPVGQALMIAGDRSPPRQKESLDRARLAVESGQTLSAALARETGMSLTIAGLISCGESSGNLAETLKLSHALMEREEELLKKCLSAMTYPAVIGLATLALTIGLVRGVMPQIIPLLNSLHADLPLLTRIVMSISQIFTAYGLQIAIGSIIGCAITVSAYRKIEILRHLAHRLIVHVPFVGKLIERYSLALFLRALGSLIESGATADAAYEKAVSSVSLYPLWRALVNKIGAIEQGGPMSAIFGKATPSYVASLVAAGEASGRLGLALSRASELVDRELDHALKRLTSLIEPMMMLGMGGLVGSIALSIMMPIYDISKTLQK